MSMGAASIFAFLPVGECFCRSYKSTFSRWNSRSQLESPGHTCCRIFFETILTALNEAEKSLKAKKLTR